MTIKRVLVYTIISSQIVHRLWFHGLGAQRGIWCRFPNFHAWTFKLTNGINIFQIWWLVIVPPFIGLHKTIGLLLRKYVLIRQTWHVFSTFIVRFRRFSQIVVWQSLFFRVNWEVALDRFLLDFQLWIKIFAIDGIWLL